LPKEWHGKPIIGILACHTGKPEEAEKAVAPIKGFGQPIGDILIRRPYAQMQSLLDATQPKGRRYYWKSEYLPRVEPALGERLLERAETFRSPHSALILFQVGGALDSLPADHSAAANRDARYVLNITSQWESAADDESNIGWAREVWNDLKSFGTGGNYINFLTADESAERIAAALGGGVERLEVIKSKWDPGNRFRANRNIAPRGSG
jgi:hypothetical protein